MCPSFAKCAKNLVSQIYVPRMELSSGLSSVESVEIFHAICSEKKKHLLITEMGIIFQSGLVWVNQISCFACRHFLPETFAF